MNAFDSNATGFANLSTIPFVPQWQYRFIAALYFAMAVPSFALHTLVLISIFKMHGHFRLYPPFYILITNHYLADIFKTLFYILYACPCIWTRSQIYGDGIGDVLGELESIDYCAILFSTFLISLNRALTIGAPALNEALFTAKMTVFYSFMTWVGGALVSCINRILRCKTAFLEDKFGFSTVCIQKPAASPGSIIIYVFVYGVIFFYLFAFWALAKQRKKVHTTAIRVQTGRHQTRLLFQALAIWIGVLGNAVAFRVIPLFQPCLGTAVATAVIIIGQSYITPVCMILYVKEVGNGVLKLFRKTVAGTV